MYHETVTISMKRNLEEVKKLQKKSREPEELGGRGVWESKGVVL